MHLASPSSITILKSADYETLHGFDESFRGHGYEDFDFLVRLYNHYFIPKVKADFWPIGHVILHCLSQGLDDT